MSRRRGNALVETALIVPFLILLLVGMAEIGRMTYVYYSVHKTLYNLARMIGTSRGANLCDAADPEVVTAKNWAVSGTNEGGESIIRGLTIDMIQVRLERQEQDSDALLDCGCTLTGCDTGQGGRPPDYVVVSIPDGLPVRVIIPYFATQTVMLRPTVRVPFGGV